MKLKKIIKFNRQLSERSKEKNLLLFLLKYLFINMHKLTFNTPLIETSILLNSKKYLKKSKKSLVPCIFFFWRTVGSCPKTSKFHFFSIFLFTRSRRMLQQLPKTRHPLTTFWTIPRGLLTFLDRNEKNSKWINSARFQRRQCKLNPSSGDAIFFCCMNEIRMWPHDRSKPLRIFWSQSAHEYIVPTT